MMRVRHSPENFPELLRIIAPNPGPMTLGGTNTYIYGSDPCVVVDPGSADETHLAVIADAAAGLGGIGVVLITHSHEDHTDGADLLGADVIHPTEGEGHGGLVAIETRGHAADHICLLGDRGLLLSGDLILGAGSTFVPPDAGSLIDYMASLRRVQQLDLVLIAPGHGPWITNPQAKIAEYIEHREMRERRLLAAIERGEHSRSALLAEVWDDVPEILRPAAAVVMEAHLGKLTDEGRLPRGLLSPDE